MAEKKKVLKLKMHSLVAEKNKKEKDGRVTLSSYDDRPSLSFTEKTLPEMKGWKIGQKYKLIIEVEHRSTGMGSYGEDKDQIRGEFKVNSVGVYNEK